MAAVAVAVAEPEAAAWDLPAPTGVPSAAVEDPATARAASRVAVVAEESAVVAVVANAAAAAALGAVEATAISVAAAASEVAVPVAREALARRVSVAALPQRRLPPAVQAWVVRSSTCRAA
jgi:hypothetical protein